MIGATAELVVDVAVVAFEVETAVVKMIELRDVEEALRAVSGGDVEEALRDVTGEVVEAW